MIALVLRGFGLHCYKESFRALSSAWPSTKIYDLRWPEPEYLDETKFIFIPGGFTFGDELGAGFMFARYLESHHPKLVERIRSPDCLVLGVCNGFQIMCHLGIFDATLEKNVQQHFLYEWTTLRVAEESFWFQGITSFEAAVRHGEGQLVTQHQPALLYTKKINGAPGAGLLSPDHYKLGMMPHPEITQTGQTNPIFQNSYQYAKQAT